MMMPLNKYDKLEQRPLLMLCRMVGEMLYELMILPDDIVSSRLFFEC